MALFNAAGACAGESRKEDANLFLMLGQVRVMADMATLIPVDKGDKGVIDLAGYLYAGVGSGLGFDDVYRDPVAVDRLARRVDTAAISFVPGYDPGWAYKPSSKVDIYDTISVNAKQQRIWQMRNFALLMQNNAYYEAHLAHEELRKRHRIFAEGTPEYAESIRLSALMSAAAESVTQLPQPEGTLPYARLNQPDTDAGFRQIATGFNGPAESKTYVFESSADATASWLARAYSPEELGKLLAGIDFDTNVLVAYSVGRRVNASGAVIVRDLEYDSRFVGYSIDIRVGVLAQSCAATEADSYPFALATVSKGEEMVVRAQSLSNFPDDCGPAVSGQPSRAN